MIGRNNRCRDTNLTRLRVFVGGGNTVTRGWVDERGGNSVGDHGETASGACTGPGMAAACLPIANDFKS